MSRISKNDENIEKENEKELTPAERFIQIIQMDEPYTIPANDLLYGYQCHVKKLCTKFDLTDPVDVASQKQLIKKILPNGGKQFYLNPGFKCDYGFNVFAEGFVSLNVNVTILDTSPVHFGNNVLVGPGTVISCAGHGIPVEERNLVTSYPIYIEDNVWIGANCTILGGVTIGEGSVIAAGSVVTKDIPKNSVVAGVPAKVLRNIY